MAESTTTEIEGERICRTPSVSLSTTKSKGQKMEYSHRLAEKRRRDRMNISISEIAQMLPSSSVSKQLEKAEILEKTISYIKTLQGLTGDAKTTCDTKISKAKENQNVMEPQESQPSTSQLDMNSKYYNGFNDCVKEVFHCLTNVEAMDIEQPCFQRLMRHLQTELEVLCKQVDLVGSDDDYKDKFSKALLDLWQSKKSPENIENPNSQHKSSSGEPASKRARRDSDKNSSSDGHGSSFSLGTVSSSSNKERRKVTLGTNCIWDENGSNPANTRSNSSVEEKEKDPIPNSFKKESGNNYDKANCDASGYVRCSVGLNCKWPSHGLDNLIQATPISPRTPYIPNPYTLPTYALHPSGTHFIPVVLHLSIPLPPFPDTNGRLNPVPNGYLGAFNQMRMGYPHFPYFAGFPFSPHLTTPFQHGGQNPKDESGQKQYQSKQRDPDPSNTNHEHLSANACTNQELSNTVE